MREGGGVTGGRGGLREEGELVGQQGGVDVLLSYCVTELDVHVVEVICNVC